MFLNSHALISVYSTNLVHSRLWKTFHTNQYHHFYTCLCSIAGQRFSRTSLISTRRDRSQSYTCNQYSSLSSASDQKQLTSSQKLKLAIKDYGATIIVFHVTISLASLGCCYAAVYSGVDITQFLEKMHLHSSQQMANVTGGVSTFVIAYAVHKVFAPARIAITLTTAPILVRYLRKLGILKAPKI